MTSNWCRIRIGDIGEVLTGNTPPKKNKEYYGGLYPWIKPTDIVIGSRYVEAVEETYSKLAYKKYKKYLLPPLSTCVVTIGTVGEKICLIKEPSFTNQSINAIIPNRQKYDPMFVFYLMKYNLPVVAKRNPGTASGRHHVSKSNFMSIEVKVPNIQIQRKISRLLSPFDDLIEINRKLIRFLEALAQTLYDEWFVLLRFPGYKKTEITQTEHGPTPKGWKHVKIGELADEIRVGVSPEDIDPATPYVGLAHIPQKSIALSEWGEVSETKSTKLLFKKRDILFAKIRPYLHKVAVAPFDGASSSDTIIIRPKTEDWYSLVLSCVSNDNFVAFADKTSKGTQMPRTDWKILQNYYILQPSDELLQKYNFIVSNNVKFIQNIIFQNKALQGIRDFLLLKLISGEIDISDIDIAE